MPRAIGVLLAVAFVVLTAPSTAAKTSVREYRPAVTRMDYVAGDLVGSVHSPRTLVGSRPLVVVEPRGADLLGPVLARQGFVVVVARQGSPERHLELWRQVDARRGPLAERFCGFAGHLDLPDTAHQPIG
ncbi:hypothetical protein LFM09_17360 [Lentzea alba]